MKGFFNVTEKDRIETIEKRVDASKLLNEFISGNIDPEYAKTALKILDNEIHIVTSYYVFKRDLAKARAEGKCFTSSFDTSKVEIIDDERGVTTTYVDRAQEFTECLLEGKNVIEKIFTGPAASSYIKLNRMYTQEGREDPLGIYCIGELGGMPVYRAPVDIIPDDIIIVERTNDLLEIKLEELRGM